MWGAGFHACLHQRCPGRKGLCSEMCKPHLVLEGVDPATGKKRTSVAACFPKGVIQNACANHPPCG
eukprot:9361929-Pyramimonas_sp.AAC.1